MIGVRTFAALAAGLPACGGLAAQSSVYGVPVGAGPGAYGCQSRTAPTLNNGVVATGSVEYAYDATTGRLTLVVDNTSPQVPGETAPVITRVGFNVPPGTVNGATLLAQRGSRGAAPAFQLRFDPNQRVDMGCFGSFHGELSVAGTPGGIGNPAATAFASWNVVLGPVTFELQLQGPGTGALSARDIATTTSLGGKPSVGAGLKFQGGGPNGSQSGWVSGGDPVCRPEFSVKGEPRVGNRIEVCVRAEQGCGGCIMVSATPGPLTVGPFTLPVGLPILAEIVVNVSAGQEVCIPVVIKPALQGQTLYFAFAAGNGRTLSFSPAFALTIR